MRACFAALLLLLLAGCAVSPPAEVAEEPAAVSELRSEGSNDTAAALMFYARTRKLSAADLAREQDAARRALTRSRSDGNRMRYALVLAVPGASAADELRALETLEPLTRNTASPLHGLALLITNLLQEQRRLDAQAQGLQQKLDAMLELERSMTGREGSVQRKR